MEAYQQRVVEELAALCEKRVALDRFIASPMYASVPRPEQGRLRRQVVAMREYAEILEERIEFFKEADA